MSLTLPQGMAHLHANGIIHGDLKPGNVLLRGCRTDRRGFVAAVADFGLSKVVRGDQPLELDRWSTVTVMAPETIQGRWHKASGGRAARHVDAGWTDAGWTVHTA